MPYTDIEITPGMLHVERIPNSDKKPLKWHIVLYDGETPLMVLDRSLSATQDECQKLADRLTTCRQCQRQWLTGEVGPGHSEHV